jgi:hypothetical protein
VTMIENVARALYDDRHPNKKWENADDVERLSYEGHARAAFEAMRDPTQGMRMAGHAALAESKHIHASIDIGPAVGFAALGDVWRAMIDDALARDAKR